MKYILSIATVAAVIGTSILLTSNEENETVQIASKTSVSNSSEEILETEQSMLDSAIEETQIEEQAVKSESSNIPKTAKVEEKKTPKKAKKTKTLKVVATPKKIEPKVTDIVKTKQAALNTTEINLPKSEEKKSKSKFSQILDVSMNTDAKETANKEKGYDTQLWYFLNYQMNDEYKARLWIDIKKDLADSYEEKLNDTKITLSKKSIKFTDKLSYTPSITTVIPTSEKSKRNQELIGGLELNTSLAYSITEKLSFSYNPRVAKNFHEYETSRTNKTNTEYKLVQFAGLGYGITDKVSVGGTLIHVNTWSYKGTRRNPNYLVVTSLGYQIRKNISLGVGTVQGGSLVQRENGPDGQVEIYDQNESSFYGNFNLRF